MRSFATCSALLLMVAGCPKRPAASPAPTSCSAYAAHLMELAEAEISATASPSVETELAMMRVSVSRIEAGCIVDDRLAEYADVVRCQMSATDQHAFDACKGLSGHDGFEAYIAHLLGSG